MMRNATVAGLLFLGVMPALAETNNFDCNNALTQAEMDSCASQAYEAADAELNKVYKQVVAAMQAKDKAGPQANGDSGSALEALRQAQRAWISYRDRQCELAGLEARGGTMEPMLVSSCLARLTRSRTKQLKQILLSSER
ncbi:DUF1311 domain-containing protein [Phyllobacterium salinisoli]|uniref:DUF1311 domain-containing protein n=1 Tax=Phyllobacterium salinisoli TaxID=1899321 RepID=A0A368JYH0_9HYPH|nr:lysozyme inhibitor LprI family protein [Phyllobacterium salinisoli]RCS22196.1 DUF1311 domain-containing protein [Phyllobacterium salinisoli]